MSNKIYEYDVPLVDYTDGIVATEEEIADILGGLKNKSNDYKENHWLICVLKGGLCSCPTQNISYLLKWILLPFQVMEHQQNHQRLSV